MELKEKIRKKFNEFVKEYGIEPIYADVMFYYSDEPDKTHYDRIKLNEEVIEKDDNLIFFYCNGLDGLLDLCNKGYEDFVLTDIDGFYLNCA